MKFDRIIYVVFAKVVEDFGVEVVGAGASPLYVFENSETWETLGFAGADSIKEATAFYTEEGGSGEVIAEYINRFGLIDFSKTTGLEVEANYLTELIGGALERDSGDFELENEVTTSLLEDEDVHNEELLSEHEGKFGVWVLSCNGYEVVIGDDRKSLTIDEADFEDLGQMVVELMFGNADQALLLID